MVHISCNLQEIKGSQREYFLKSLNSLVPSLFLCPPHVQRQLASQVSRGTARCPCSLPARSGQSTELPLFRHRLPRRRVPRASQVLRGALRLPAGAGSCRPQACAAQPQGGAGAAPSGFLLPPLPWPRGCTFPSSTPPVDPRGCHTGSLPVPWSQPCHVRSGHYTGFLSDPRSQPAELRLYWEFR